MAMVGRRGEKKIWAHNGFLPWDTAVFHLVSAHLFLESSFFPLLPELAIIFAFFCEDLNSILTMKRKAAGPADTKKSARKRSKNSNSASSSSLVQAHTYPQ